MKAAWVGTMAKTETETCSTQKQSLVTAWDDQAPPPSSSCLSAGNVRQHTYKVCKNWTLKCMCFLLEEGMRRRLKNF